LNEDDRFEEIDINQTSDKLSLMKKLMGTCHGIIIEKDELNVNYLE